MFFIMIMFIVKEKIVFKFKEEFKEGSSGRNFKEESEEILKKKAVEEILKKKVEAVSPDGYYYVLCIRFVGSFAQINNLFPSP